jgi:hypothetical protein
MGLKCYRKPARFRKPNSGGAPSAPTVHHGIGRQTAGLIQQLSALGPAVRLRQTSNRAGQRPRIRNGRRPTGNLWPVPTGRRKLSANSLFSDNNSLFSLQKFPAPLRREFFCKPLNLPADFLLESPTTAEIGKNSLQIPCITGNSARESGFDKTATSAMQSACVPHLRLAPDL